MEIMILNEFKMDEQLVDTDSDKQSNEKIIQKINSKTIKIKNIIFIQMNLMKLQKLKHLKK